MADRLISVPAARSHIDAVVADPILKACMHNVLDGLPAADAAPVVHGRWVGTQYDGYADGYPVYDLWECSECREEYESEGDPPPFNYCPHCGSKMDM